MKKLILILAVAACCTVAAEAKVRYKGYVESSLGFTTAPRGGAQVGYFSTSHGINIIDGLFVGLGAEISTVDYFTAIAARLDDPMYSEQLSAFAECRYSFLRTKKVSPYVAIRQGFGGGYTEYLNEAVLGNFGSYLNLTLIGITVNVTRRFGFDAGLNVCETAYVFSGMNISLGVHF